MIDLNKHIEEVIDDANMWRPLECSPLDRCMYFAHGSQTYIIMAETKQVLVVDEDRGSSNDYALTTDEFSRLLDALRFDE